MVIAIGYDEATNVKVKETTTKRSWFSGFGSKKEDEDNSPDESVIGVFFKAILLT